MPQHFDFCCGDLEAVHRLLARWEELVEMLLHLGFAGADAENAVQEALIRALQWVDSGRFSCVKNEISWLRTVAVRAALTIIGRECAFAVICREPESHPFDDFDREEEQRVRLAAIFEATARLPDHLRTVFTYCKLDGHTINETAEQFGLECGQVSGRIKRAIAAIQRDLGIKKVAGSRRKVSK